MAIRIHSGHFDVESLAKFRPFRALALLHGGAGPADPKGDAATQATRQMAELTERLLGADFDSGEGPAFAPFLAGQRAPATRSEKIALHAAKLLEAEPQFNAGYGAAIQADGIARVSASFIESTRGRFSAVTNVTGVRHPSELAYYLQHERFTMLDSTGGGHLARNLRVPVEELITAERFRKWAKQREKTLEGTPMADGTGTIGCVCVSAEGDLAAVTSTGGTGNETPGRVGDSPTASGNYCTRRIAISCTGFGEQIVDMGFATRLAVRVEDGTELRAALEKSLTEADARGFEFAAIAVALSPDGRVAHWATGSTARHLTWAAVSPKGVFTDL